MDQEKSKLGLLRFNDELAGLIKNFGAYKQGKEEMKSSYLNFMTGLDFTAQNGRE